MTTQLRDLTITSSSAFSFITGLANPVLVVHSLNSDQILCVRAETLYLFHVGSFNAIVSHNSAILSPSCIFGSSELQNVTLDSVFGVRNTIPFDCKLISSNRG